jgi:hypothetical protein
VNIVQKFNLTLAATAVLALATVAVVVHNLPTYPARTAAVPHLCSTFTAAKSGPPCIPDANSVAR